MNAQRRWYELLLPGMAVLLVLSSGTLRTAKAYDYIQDPWEGCKYESDPVDESSSSHTEWGYATAKADVEYECKCKAIAYAEANDNSADASVNSQALWLTSWTWDGPPESNPPGGELTWDHDADGDYTGAWGYNPTSGISISGAAGDSWTYAEDDSAYADIDCFGYIDNGTAGGYAVRDAEPIEYFDGEPYEYTDSANYLFLFDDWSLDLEPSVMEVIDPGTTYFYFVGGVTCDVDTSTISTEETDPWANAYGEAEVRIVVSAEFVSYE